MPIASEPIDFIVFAYRWNKIVSIKPISTKKQVADILTKPITEIMQVETDKKQTTATRMDQPRAEVEKHLKGYEEIIINSVDSGFCVQKEMTFQEGVNMMRDGDVLTIRKFYDGELDDSPKRAMDEVVANHPNGKYMEVNWRCEWYDDLWRLRVFYGVEIPDFSDEDYEYDDVWLNWKTLEYFGSST